MPLTIEDVATRLSTQLNISLSLEPNSPAPLIIIPADLLRDASKFLRDDDALRFESLNCITGVERAGAYEIVITLYSATIPLMLNLKVKATGEDPAIPSVTDIWPAADWHEREVFDMFGIRFEGHYDHRRILCADDWEGFPLRKDYQPPLFFHNIPVTVNVPGGLQIPLTRIAK